MGIKTARLADRVYHFTHEHGHLVSTALRSVMEEQRDAAARMAGVDPRLEQVFRESERAYQRAMDAWEALQEAAEEDDGDAVPQSVAAERLMATRYRR